MDVKVKEETQLRLKSRADFVVFHSGAALQRSTDSFITHLCAFENNFACCRMSHTNNLM